MKLVIRTIVFHIICILIFAIIYHKISNDFTEKDETGNSSAEKKKYKMLDCLMLSVTIQAGVGHSPLMPTTNYSKLVLIIQQFILISTHVITLYIFTL